MDEARRRYPVSVAIPVAVRHDHRAGPTAPVEDALRDAIAALEAAA